MSATTPLRLGVRVAIVVFGSAAYSFLNCGTVREAPLARDHRRLAAIVSADVVGYSLLMGRDDSATLAGLKAHRREVIDPKIAEYGGRIVKTTGDGLLLEFPSVVDAVRCAVDVQRGMAERNTDMPADRRIEFRIGINVGDIIIDGDDIFGDGVNVAARLQTLAEPGGICVSRVVRDQVLDKLSFAFEDLGSQQVKNIARPVDAYRVDLGSVAPQAQSRGQRRWQRLTRAVGSQWLVAGVFAVALAGIAVWTLPQFWKTAPPLAPPAMSVAITPLIAPRRDADSLRVAEGLTQNLVTRLGRVGRVRARVVSGNSPVSGSNGAIDPRELGHRLNVRYVLEGDVLHGADGDTVNLRFVDATTGEQVWAERSTLQDSDILAASSAGMRSLIDRLRAALVRAESQRVMTQALASLNASELVLRAYAVWNKDRSIVGATEAVKLVDEALRLEPNLVPALVARAYLMNFKDDVDPNSDHDRIAREQAELTARATTLDPTDSAAWDWHAVALEYLGRMDAALEANGTSIRLDPDNPSFYLKRAWLMNMAGRPNEALPLTEQALALDPAQIGNVMRATCEAHLLAGHAEQAIATCEKAASLGNDPLNNLFLAAAYANHGDMAKAASAKADALRTMPGYTIARLRAKRYSEDPEYQRLAEKYWYEGLRKAGFPEQ
jgi:adenylate cyclase